MHLSTKCGFGSAQHLISINLVPGTPWILGSTHVDPLDGHRLIRTEGHPFVNRTESSTTNLLNEHIIPDDFLEILALLTGLGLQ